MARFSKPETVLRQAEGLISVGQTHGALQSLTEMFNSKRFRSTPVASLEPIMLRFIELCVDLRKGRTAKEGLMQYKNITQNTSVASIELVIQRFIELSNQKVQEAQAKASQAVAIVDVDDLEASESPEDILLSAVSGDQSKDRTDRALVTPWLKFLWESYRSALETLKNNARLETVYQSIAIQAFKFCLHHSRKVEFRRLCETLRLHLANVAKYSHQAHSINLSDPDTLQHFLDTRFVQLNTSVELELWQEAFRSIEDIHSLLTMSKRPPKPTMMVNYYEKLYKIFITSGSILYHAAAWSKYYAIVRTAGLKNDEELAHCASLVLLSALAVPTATEIVEDGDETKGKHARLTTLLGLGKVPTRSRLLNEAISRNVLKSSARPLQQLYRVLEVDFDPLELCEKVAPTLETLSTNEDFAPYMPHLRRVVLSRLLSQLAQVYTSISISHLLNLAAPLNDKVPEGDPSRFDQENIEAFIMNTAKRGELLVRINHSEGSLTFVDDALSTKVASTSNALQPPPGALVRTRLSTLAQCLFSSLEYICPPPPLQQQLKVVFEAARAERKALQLRRSIVARRRELLAELIARKQSEERSQQAEQARRAQEEAQKKKREDVVREAQARAKAEMDRRKMEESVKIVSSLKDKGVNVNIDEMDTDKLVQLQVEQMDREKRELNERMRIIAKRLDHIERAFRKAELPLLADDYARQQTDDEVAFEATRQQTLEAARQAHQERIATKQRLARMTGDYKKYVADIQKKRDTDYCRRQEDAASKITQEKAKRREIALKERAEEAARQEAEDRALQEKEEALAKAERERRAEEAKEAAEAEAVRAAEEAKKTAEEEKAAARRKQREQERAEAAKTAEMQMKREQEAEERRRQQKLEASKPSAAAAAAPSSSGDVWRRGSTRQEPTPSASPRTASGSLPQAGPARFVPPAQRATAGADAGGPPAKPGWREREQARLQATNGSGSGRNSPVPSSPALGRNSPAPRADDDGFQTVGKPKPSPGAYRPPAARNQNR